MNDESDEKKVNYRAHIYEWPRRGPKETGRRLAVHSGNLNQRGHSLFLIEPIFLQTLGPINTRSPSSIRPVPIADLFASLVAAAPRRFDFLSPVPLDIDVIRLKYVSGDKKYKKGKGKEARHKTGNAAYFVRASGALIDRNE